MSGNRTPFFADLSAKDGVFAVEKEDERIDL